MNFSLENDHKNKVVAKWIFVGIAMIIVQVLLGGITRLTGSGLSMTEWKPIMGFLPPMNETQWQQDFQEYQKIAQFKYINNHFSLSDFKFIFFWEWFHRLWARLIALAFAIPFIYFLAKSYIKNEYIKPLIILVLLGALEGALGWIMVQSGLNENNVYVNHIKLSVHFIFAMLIISYAVVFAFHLITPSSERVENNSLKKLTIGIVVIVAIQLIYGAYMAGLKAANAAPTWPLVNDSFIPTLNITTKEYLFFNRISIHIIHRSLAYIIGIATFIWWLQSKKITVSKTYNKVKHLPLVLVVVQIALGIASVLLSPKIVQGHFGIFEWFALFHQLAGMLLLLSFMANIYLLKFKK